MSECTEPECAAPAIAKGRCKRHYNLDYWAKYKGKQPPRVLKFCVHDTGCELPVVAQGLCDKHYRHTFYKAGPRGSRGKDRELQKAYGISLQQYNAMALQQHGLCAVCAQPPRNKYGLCVDHCHQTKRVRGLLCAGCNTALGTLERPAEW